MNLAQQPPESIAQAVERTLTVLHRVTQAPLIEIRVPNAPQGSLRGYYVPQDFGQAARDVASIEAPATYVSLNPPRDEFYARSPSRLSTGAATADSETSRRLLLLLDFDPVRPAKTSSTDTEKAAALERARACCGWLLTQGWPSPIPADSGNGYHLLYPIDLPNDDASRDLIARILKVLDQKFSDDVVKVDTTVGNASRITKLYGTPTRKGPATPERPHRRSALLELPRTISQVPLKQLEAVAALYQKPQPKPANRNDNGNDHRAEYSEIESALFTIDPNPRENWLHGGAALHDHLGEGGRDLWDEWSKQSPKYDEQDQDRTWRGFEAGGGITIKSLFKLAYDAGWPGPSRKAPEPPDDDDPFADLPKEPPSKKQAKTSESKDGKDDDEPWKAARVAEAIAHKGEHFARDVGGNLHVYRAGVYVPKGEQRIRALTKAIVPPKQWSTYLANETIAYILADAQPLEERPPLNRINLLNGILNTDTRTLQPHRPDFLSQVQLPVEYRPDAQCPEWDKQLKATLPDDVYEVGVIFFVIAWLMLPIIWIEKALLLLGDGGTGKSTLLGAILHFLGGHRNVSSVTLQRLESDRFSVARLVGRLANICADLPSLHLETSDTFKKLTGGGKDQLSGEFKFKDGFDFIPFARLLFSANQPPVSKDATSAFFERWLVIAMNKVFRGTAQEISRKELDAKLTTPSELSGVLNRALDALPLLLAWGIPVTDSMREAHDDFQEVTDPLNVWLNAHTVENPTSFTRVGELMSAYNADASGAGRPVVGKVAFGSAMKRLRPKVTTAQKYFGGIKKLAYCGIGLRAESAPDGGFDDVGN